MAEVFRAKAYGVEGFERLLAVKRILPNIAEDKEFIEMFIDEAKLAVQLSHANICQIFDLGKVENFHFIALEYVHGKDLRALFDRCKQRPEGGAVTMPLAQACFVVMKVCEGLDYAHNKKDPQGRELHLVHRDVSPQNVIISYDGEVKLIDFGIAKSVGKASKTQAGILKGKFGYMSPEQVRGLPLDRRSDVFSLGILIYELLTGERLFTGETDFSTLEKVRNVEILPPSTYNRRIADELERIVMKTLSKDVEDRYQNAIDLHDDLQAFMYTAGEFYSRKDLAAWMKRAWSKEIAEESTRLEAYRAMPAPASVLTPAPVSSGRSLPTRPAQPPPPPGLEVSGARPAPSGRAASLFKPGGARKGSGDPDLEWDDEELETHVYENAKDASDAVVDETEAFDDLIEEGSNGRAAAPSAPSVDDFDLSPDGAPVLAKSQPGASEPSLPPFSSGPRNGAAKPRDFALPAPTRPSFDRPGALDIPQMGTAIARPAQPKRPTWPLYAGIGGTVAVVGVAAMLLLLMSRPGELQITTDPATGVRVLLDNKPVHLDEAGRLKIDPGVYSVAVEGEGFVQWRDKVEVKSGEVVKRRVELEPLARAGMLLYSDPPGALAFLDGKDLGGKTPFKVEGLTPGKHVLEVQVAGRTWSEPVVLEPGKMIDVHANLGPPAVTPQALPPPVLVAENTRPALIDPLPPPVLPPPVRQRRERPVEVAARPVRPARPDPEDEPARPPRARPVIAEEAPRPKRLPSLPAEGDTPVKASGGGEGFLRLGSRPNTNIIIDGKDTGKWTPQTQLRLAAGSHKVTLTNPQFGIKESFTVDIKSGESETVIKDLRSQGGATSSED